MAAPTALIGFFDESGKDDGGRIFALAGFVAEPQRWGPVRALVEGRAEARGDRGAPTCDTSRTGAATTCRSAGVCAAGR